MAVLPPVNLAPRTAPSSVPPVWVSPNDSAELRVPTASGEPLRAVKMGAILHPPSKRPIPFCDRKNGSDHSRVWLCELVVEELRTVHGLADVIRVEHRIL